MIADTDTKHHRWRRRSRRRRRTGLAFYARIMAIGIGLGLAGWSAWWGFDFVRHRFGEPAPMPGAARSGQTHRSAPPWQSDVLDSLGAAASQVQAGKIMEGEMAVDRGAALIEAATVSSRQASDDFFEMASARLDGVIRIDPQNGRLLEHVALARIALAQLRSHLAGSLDAGDSSANNSAAFEGAAGSPGPARPAEGHVAFGEPRSLAADHVFGPQQAAGDWLDARSIADSEEILLPPSSRLLVDNVRVEDLTIEGAAQTLDGIRWKNVTFIETRIRYEGGEVDLRNVHFVRCRFGFSTDGPGSRLANAIALGQSSIVID